MNTANEINPCPLYNRYNQIQRGWELDGEKISIVHLQHFERAFLEHLFIPGALGVPFRCIKIHIHIITCLLSEDCVIRHVRVASLSPRACLLICFANWALQATHIICLKAQVECYQCSMIVSGVVVFTSMVDAIDFEIDANNPFYNRTH